MRTRPSRRRFVCCEAWSRRARTISATAASNSRTTRTELTSRHLAPRFVRAELGLAVTVGAGEARLVEIDRLSEGDEATVWSSDEESIPTGWALTPRGASAPAGGARP